MIHGQSVRGRDDVVVDGIDVRDDALPMTHAAAAANASRTPNCASRHEFPSDWRGLVRQVVPPVPTLRTGAHGVEAGGELTWNYTVNMERHQRDDDGVATDQSSVQQRERAWLAPRAAGLHPRVKGAGSIQAELPERPEPELLCALPLHRVRALAAGELRFFRGEERVACRVVDKLVAGQYAPWVLVAPSQRNGLGLFALKTFLPTRKRGLTDAKGDVVGRFEGARAVRAYGAAAGRQKLGMSQELLALNAFERVVVNRWVALHHL